LGECSIAVRGRAVTETRTGDFERRSRDAVGAARGDVAMIVPIAVAFFARGIDISLLVG
jgi:hypothetical protein